MAVRYEVKCINKSDRPNPHERILSIGGMNADGSPWKVLQVDAINAIEAGQREYYVSRAGRVVNVIVALSRFQNKYLKTEADGQHQISANGHATGAEAPGGTGGWRLWTPAFICR